MNQNIVTLIQENYYLLRVLQAIMERRVRDPLLSLVRVFVALGLSYALVAATGTLFWPTMDSIVAGLATMVGAIIILFVTR